MTERYRVTVRTVDGTRYISDYEEQYMAIGLRDHVAPAYADEKRMNTAHWWTEGGTQVIIRVCSVAGVSIERIDDDSESYVGKIVIEERA